MPTPSTFKSFKIKWMVQKCSPDLENNEYVKNPEENECAERNYSKTYWFISAFIHLVYYTANHLLATWLIFFVLTKHPSSSQVWL